jgi:hypothetical protein
MTPKQLRGYQPTEPPEPARLNIDEIERIKKLFEDSPLAKYIILAGVGGVAGVVLVLIEVGRVIVELFHYFNR